METRNLSEDLKSRNWNLGQLSQFFKRGAVLQKTWILFSIPFVLFTLWTRVEQGFYDQGVQVGSRRVGAVIYKDIITKARNQACRTIFVEHEGSKVDLINVDCLRKIAKEETDASVAQAAKSSKRKTAKGKVN